MAMYFFCGRYCTQEPMKTESEVKIKTSGNEKENIQLSLQYENSKKQINLLEPILEEDLEDKDKAHFPSFVFINDYESNPNQKSLEEDNEKFLKKEESWKSPETHRLRYDDEEESPVEDKPKYQSSHYYTESSNVRSNKKWGTVTFDNKDQDEIEENSCVNTNLNTSPVNILKSEISKKGVKKIIRYENIPQTVGENLIFHSVNDIEKKSSQSCKNCQEAFKQFFLLNKPLKETQCKECNQLLNHTSLLFYFNKLQNLKANLKR